MRPSRFRDGSPRGKKRAGRRGPPPKVLAAPQSRVRGGQPQHITHPNCLWIHPGVPILRDFSCCICHSRRVVSRESGWPPPPRHPHSHVEWPLKTQRHPHDPNRSAAGRCPPLPQGRRLEQASRRGSSRPCGSIKRSRVSRAAIAGTIRIRADRWESGRHEAATRGGCEGPRGVSTRLLRPSRCFQPDTSSHCDRRTVAPRPGSDSPPPSDSRVDLRTASFVRTINANAWRTAPSTSSVGLISIRSAVTTGASSPYFAAKRVHVSFHSRSGGGETFTLPMVASGDTCGPYAWKSPM